MSPGSPGLCLLNAPTSAGGGAGMKAPTRFRIPLPDFRRVAQPVGGATHLPPALSTPVFIPRRCQCCVMLHLTPRVIFRQ
jgi:hypothetical protein